MSEMKSTDTSLSRKRPLSRGTYGAESEDESSTGSDNGNIGGGNYETKLMKRERNRQTAKLNRDRKKEEARELQETVQYLKRKNQDLQNELNSQPSFLADEHRLVMSFERHFSTQITSTLNALRVRAESDSGAFYVINAASHFFPIIYASPAFVQLTGYSLHEIIGQNCGFLSGLQTSRNERERLNLALQQGQDIAATLLNYRRDGTMFWNNLHLANLHARINGEEVPHLIVGLHSEVFAKRSLLLDSASTEKDDHADSGSSSRSQQSGRGSHFSGTQAIGGGGSSGTSASSGTAKGASTEGNKHSTTLLQNNSTLCFTPTMPVSTELRRVSSDDDDHTILQEIISSHQRGLSETQIANSAALQRPGIHSRPSRGKGPLSTIINTHAGRGVRTRGMLEQSVPAVRAALKIDTIPVATGVYHPTIEPRGTSVKQLAQPVLHSPRCNSVMSAITMDGTDNEASSASPANVMHLNAHDMSYIDRAMQRCESANSLASETAPLSNYFASASLINPAENAGFTSLANMTPKMTPSRALPGPFPGLQGLSSGTLRHLGVESYSSPPCKVGEVPLFQHPAAPRRSGSAASNVSNSSGSSSVHETTSLRRNYFSALEEHLIAESHDGALQVTQYPPRAAAALGSPLPVSPGAGTTFTPNANTPFQMVRRVSLGEDTERMSGYTTQCTASGSSDSAERSRQSLKVAFTPSARPFHSDHHPHHGAQDTTRDSLESDFDLELATYMDPSHVQRTPLKQRTAYNMGASSNATTLPHSGASADDVWAAWETGTIVDPRHLHTATTKPSATSSANSVNAAIAAEVPTTPKNVPLAPVGCAPWGTGATSAVPTTVAAPDAGALGHHCRW